MNYTKCVVEMRIEIRKGGEAVIISFHTRVDNFDSDYERITFFRKLHGWNQTVPKNGKKYVYRRMGLLEEIPHEKIADSVFIMARKHMKMMEKFFKGWETKVDYEIMEVMLKNDRKYINDQEE